MSEADRLERTLEEDREHLRETLGALEEKMSPGRLLDEAMSYFNTGPKAFASDIATQIKDRPMPALITGVGLAWLMMSDAKAAASQESQAPVSDAGASGGFDLGSADFEPSDYEAWETHDRLQQAEWSCVRLDAETDEAFSRRLDQARAAALGVGYDVQEDHAGFSSRVRSLADAAKQKGASARDKLKRAAVSGKHGASAAARTGAQSVKGAAKSSQEGVKAALSSGARLHESNPIATAAIGVAIGALFGASLPLTRQEEAALGPVADIGLQKGADLSRKASDALSQSLGSGEPQDQSESPHQPGPSA